MCEELILVALAVRILLPSDPQQTLLKDDGKLAIEAVLTHAAFLDLGYY